MLPLITLYLVWQVPDGVALEYRFLGYTLALVKGDALSRLFATIFAVMAFAGDCSRSTSVAWSSLRRPAATPAAPSASPSRATCSTVFIFWELMAIASTLVVWSAGPSARGAGLALRRGPPARRRSAAWPASPARSRRDRSLRLRQSCALDSVPRWLILAGFLINAGAPPLSAWLPDAYPEAPERHGVPVGVHDEGRPSYVLLRASPGTELLIYVGLFMVFYGIVYAILENDMRRILAYSIVNQVGLHGDAASASAPRWRSTAPPRTPSPTSSTRRCC